MTSKEKAEQLYKYFEISLPDAVEIHKGTVKDCALKVVDEVLNVIGLLRLDYWEQVKQEIEKL